MTQLDQAAPAAKLSPRGAFRAAYMLHLAKAHNASPETYAWSVEELPAIVDRMVAALARGDANIDSPAIKAACKTCGFKPGIARIRQFLACNTWDGVAAAVSP